MSLFRSLNKIILVGFYSAVFLVGNIHAQHNPMDYKRWNTLNINKIATTFDNVGMMCDGNNQNYSLARPPSFEFPQGSGKQYGTCVAVVVGAPADQNPEVVGGVNTDNYPYLDGTQDEGPSDFWNEEHFAPYPEFVNPNVASISNDKNSWPEAWPSELPNYIYKDGVTDDKIVNDNLPAVLIKLDPQTGWPGMGPNGEQLSDQETFSVMYGWGGTDQLGSGNSKTRWLRTQLIMRSMAWQGSLYENFIVWVFVIRNPNNKPIKDVRMGIHLDLGFFPAFIPGINYDDDRHYYDPKLQLAYGWDDDGFEENPIGGGSLGAADIAWGGAVVIKMPGGNGKVKTYDATHFWQGQTTNVGSGGDPEMYYKWNLLNLNDPEDSNGDGIDDDFDHNGVPDADEGGKGYYLGTGADGLQVIGSDSFTMQPGETDTLIFATVFGTTEQDLKTNAQRAVTLYENNWKPVKAPPSPVVEAFTDDRKVVLVWNTDSEKDPEFEGYKIYRSQDNGQTWGSDNFTDFQGGVKYVPLAQFDKIDGIKDNYKTLPEYAWFYLGSDSWISSRYLVEGDSIKGFSLGNKLNYFKNGDSVNVYVDRDVTNGVKYKYYIAAYDSGNGIVGPLENTPSAKPNSENNTVLVRPELQLAENDLSKVRVVPNPYITSNIYETGWNEHIIQFTGLPSEATIKIYNSSGELIKTLIKNNSSSIQEWNLKNEFDQLIAPGVYFFYLTSPLGSQKGKFFIIL